MSPAADCAAAAAAAKPRKETEEVSFQWKNPDFLIKNAGFLFKNADFMIKMIFKNVDFYNINRMRTSPQWKAVFGLRVEKLN